MTKRVKTEITLFSLSVYGKKKYKNKEVSSEIKVLFSFEKENWELYILKFIVFV